MVRRFAPRLLSLLLLIAAGDGCRRRPSLEQRARDLLVTLEGAAQEGDVDRIRQLVSPEFRGPDDLARGPAMIMLRAWLRERPVHILSRILTLEVQEPAGTVQVELVAAMAALPVDTPADLGRLQADIYRWNLTLAVTDGELLVASARWAPARLLDFQ